jgi:hypothetical protein
LKNLGELASVLRVQGEYVAAGAVERLLREKLAQALGAHQDSLSEDLYGMLLLSRERKSNEVEDIPGLAVKE